jgi:hypothetical protein
MVVLCFILFLDCMYEFSWDFVLSSIRRAWYCHCDLNFRILTFRLRMFSSSLIFRIWSFLVWPPLWSSGQSSRLQIQSPGSIPGAIRFYEKYWVWNGDPLSLVRINEELLDWKSSGAWSRTSRLTAVGIRCADHATPSIRKKLILTLPTCGGRSIGIVRLRTKATEFSF